jgi:hypothetical protein
VVRASAPRHMVALGSEGPTPWPGYVRTSILDDHKAVDYVAIHVWPQNWLWYDPIAAADTPAPSGAGGGAAGSTGTGVDGGMIGSVVENLAGGLIGALFGGVAAGGSGRQVTSGGAARPVPASSPRTLGSAIKLSAAYIDAAARAAVALGKPLVVEEFGLAREGASMDASSPTGSRDVFYRWMCAHVAETAPGAGLNFWAWAGEGRAGQLVGDPPHEPQGWYSVFDTDLGTHAAIYECSQRLAGDPQARRKVTAAAPAAGADPGANEPPPIRPTSGGWLARHRQLKRRESQRQREPPTRRGEWEEIPGAAGRGERGEAPGAAGNAVANGALAPPPPTRLTVIWSVDMEKRMRAPTPQALSGGSRDAAGEIGSRHMSRGWLSRPPGGSSVLAHALVQSALICFCLCCCWALVHRLLRCARRRRVPLPARQELLRRSSESDLELETDDGHDRRAAGGVSFRRGQVRTPSPSWGLVVGRPGAARPAAPAEHESGYGGDCES